MDNIRIIDLPRCRMATSGPSTEEDPFAPGGRLMTFQDWWTAYDRTRTDRWFRRDFITYERETHALWWYFAVADGEAPDCPYEIVDFEGGLYAAAVAVDGDEADGLRVYEAIKQWVADSDGFQLDERPGHYDLSQVITPKEAEAALGFLQLEIYVPIRLKG